MSPLITLIAVILSVCALFVNILAELKRDLMMFQQNSYRPERYGRWLSSSGDTTSMWRLAALALLFFSLSTFSAQWLSAVLFIIFGLASSISLISRKYKKPLVWTARSKRIYGVSVFWTLAVTVGCAFIFGEKTLITSFYAASIALMGCYCCSHILILFAGWCLKPVEKAITNRYINEARNILKSMPDLKIVGITGSYGKTSTKHFLHHILSAEFDTLMTPGSYNTTLGVVRTIRELLKPYNEIFIVEMGAKNKGDIKEICDLVHPSVGIITAVGPQHLESFKTIENVQATKFELADALPSTGTAIVNDDFEKIGEREVNNAGCIRYAVQNTAHADYRAEDIKYTSEGTEFRIVGPGDFSLQVRTRLLGECNVSNLLAAAAAARVLGVPDKKIASAIASIQPVEHRLSVKSTPGGLTIIDDAFNSNPVGSRMAVEVLGTFTSGKRVIVTPGMIELGAEQYEANFSLGQTIARNTDVAIIVGKYNREALVDGIESEKAESKTKIQIADTFADAQKILSSFAAKGDTVLYENDLPDTFK